MPIHDWTRVDAGVWHGFHIGWVAEFQKVLNLGGLPEGWHALIQPGESEGGADEIGEYARRRRTVTIRKDADDEVVALIEIVSPGTKATRVAFESFVRKATAALASGIHLLLIDLFPPTPCDPLGAHHAIWATAACGASAHVTPFAAPLTVVSYSAGAELAAYVEPVSVGEPAPDMPLFLTPDSYVTVSLESTYTASFAGTPKKFRQILA
jgi:hypothetical protein